MDGWEHRWDKAAKEEAYRYATEMLKVRRSIIWVKAVFNLSELEDCSYA
jgi:hypothetical protein